MRTARENVLINGLFDWVSLSRIHSDVMEENREAPVTQLQSQVLALIHSLLSEGLFEVGNVTRTEGFVRWTTPVEESLRRIHDIYVTGYDDKDRWLWGCWLELTEKGQRVAQSVENTTSDDPLG